MPSKRGERSGEANQSINTHEERSATKTATKSTGPHWKDGLGQVKKKRLKAPVKEANMYSNERVEDEPEAPLAPLHRVASFVGSSHYVKEGALLALLQPKSMRNILLGLLNDFDVADRRKLFLTDPRDYEGYTDAIQRGAMWTQRVRKLIQAERPLLTIESVMAQMFSNARIFNADDAIILEYVGRCETVWDAQVTRLHEAIANHTKALQHKPDNTTCALCLLTTTESSARSYPCAGCDGVINNGTDFTLLLKADLFVVLCPKCKPEAASPTGQGPAMYTFEGQLFRGNQVFRKMPGSKICKVKLEWGGCDCDRWEHASCAGIVVRQLANPDVNHVCNHCVRKNKNYVAALQNVGPDDDPYRARKVPQANTPRAVHVRKTMATSMGKPTLSNAFVVVEASRTMEVLELSAAARCLVKALGGTEWDAAITYRQTFFLLIHQDDNGAGDCLVAVIVLHEYMSGPLAGVAYLAYLDSGNHVDSALRSPAITGFVLGVLHSAALLGYKRQLIYSLTPQTGSAYILHDRPVDMLMDKPEAQQQRLLTWYRSMLAHARTNGWLPPAASDEQAPLCKDMGDTELLQGLVLCEGDVTLKALEHVLLKGDYPDGAKAKWTATHTQRVKKDLADAMAMSYVRGDAVFDFSMQLQGEGQPPHDWVQGDIETSPLFGSTHAFLQATKYFAYDWSTPRQARHATRSLVDHLLNPKERLFAPRCTMCMHPIPGKGYIGCSKCKGDGPRFCAACGKTTKTKPRAMQEARKSRPEHFWRHDAHGGEDTDWVVLDLEPEPDAVKEELVKVE